MPEPYADTLTTVAAGRTAAVAQLPELATRLEQLPLEAVAEVLVLVEPTLDDLRRQARARARTRTSSPPLTPGAPRALFEPPRAAREALAVVVLAADFAALAVKHDKRPEKGWELMPLTTMPLRFESRTQATRQEAFDTTTAVPSSRHR